VRAARAAGPTGPAPAPEGRRAAAALRRAERAAEAAAARARPAPPRRRPALSPAALAARTPQARAVTVAAQRLARVQRYVALLRGMTPDDWRTYCARKARIDARTAAEREARTRRVNSTLTAAARTLQRAAEAEAAAAERAAETQARDRARARELSQRYAEELRTLGALDGADGEQNNS
jgi:hypothetical protein